MRVQSILSAFALALLTLSSGPASANKANGSPTDAHKISVADFSGLSGFQDYVTKHLSPGLKSAILSKDLALWGFTAEAQIGDKNYCIASVGLTHAEATDRNPRHPVVTASSVLRQTPENWDAGACRAEVMQRAIAKLNKIKLQMALEDVEHTRLDGGTRPLDDADNTMIYLSGSGLSSGGKNRVAKVMLDLPISKIFDYRYVETSVLANSFLLDDGERLCWSIAGLTARNPEGRESRYPGFSVAYAFTQQGGGDDECRTSSAVGAVQTLFNKPWTSSGILNDFARAREDGIPVPDSTLVAKQYAEMAAKKPTQ